MYLDLHYGGTREYCFALDIYRHLIFQKKIFTNDSVDWINDEG